MPADFLMPLFVLTLLANAVLVAFAIRGMRNGQYDPDRRWPGDDRPPSWGRPRSEPPIVTASGSDVVSPALPDGVRRSIAEPPPTVEPASVVDATPAVDPPTLVDLAPAVDPAPPINRSPGRPIRASTPPRPRRPATGPAADATTGPPPVPGVSKPTSTKRGRRRFSLPNLDDDHEKVSRSIETFLGGADVVGGGGSTPVEDRIEGTVDGGGATTVVLVAVAGLPAEAGRSRSRAATKTPRARAVESGTVADSLALVERTLRNAARGTDIVTGEGRGRFRIVMASTGELAARAYLRRARTTIEPGLEASDVPLRLVVATATVLDEPVEIAIRRATDRLSGALEAAALAGRGVRSVETTNGPDDAPSAPRAAAD